MISARLKLGDGVIGKDVKQQQGGSGGETAMSNHGGRGNNNQLVEEDTHHNKHAHLTLHHLTTTDECDVSEDHDMQELEWEEGWYENDLHLAAELGKTLLEKNKELEANLLVAQQENEEQAMQVVYLEKQLQILRDVTESKSTVYEQLDLNSQELEKNNNRLEHELRTAQQRIIRMTENIDNLESKSQEQQSQIDHIRARERDRLKEGRRQKKIIEALGSNVNGYPMRRARSFDLGRVTADSIFEDEIVNLHEKITNLKERLSAQEPKRLELELELEVLLKENQLLDDRVHELEVKTQLAEIEQDCMSLNQQNEAICKYCDSLINAEEDEDEDFVDSSKLSAQGGRGSQELGTIAEENPNSDVPPKADGISLFTEIDSQYHELMDKYNSLLKRSRSGSFRDENARPRSSSIRGRKVDSSMQTSTHSSPARTPTAEFVEVETEAVCVVDNHFHDTPPEYKRLFKDIFSILHKKSDKSSEKS